MYHQCKDFICACCVLLLSLLALPLSGFAQIPELVDDFNKVPATVQIGSGGVGLGAVFYFPGTDPEHGTELWRSDGTAEGTAMVADIRPGPDGSIASRLKLVGDVVIFRADDGTLGLELYTVGKDPSTLTLLLDINPNGDGVRSDLFVGHDKGIYFVGDDGIHGLDPWRSDGTAARTAILADTALPDSQSANSFADFIGRSSTHTFFRTRGQFSIGEELWAFADSASGMQLLKSFEQLHSFSPSVTGALDEVFFFEAQENFGDPVGLWKSDGTIAGSKFVKDINTTLINGSPSGDSIRGDPTAFQGELYFAADDGIHGKELWKSDGNEGGTVLVADINPIPGADGLSQILGRDKLPAGNFLPLFATDGFTGFEPFVFNGTQVSSREIRTGPANSNVFQGDAINQNLFFFAEDDFFGFELYRYSGLDASVVRITDRNPGARNFFSLAGGFSTPVRVQSLVYFPGFTGEFGLWRSNGTDAGTSLVKNLSLNSGNLGSFFSSLSKLFGESYFSITTTEEPDGGIFTTDGTAQGTAFVSKKASFGSGVESAIPGVFLFLGLDAESGLELWRSDGTDGGTALLKDIVPGPQFPQINSLTRAGTKVFFSASTTGSAADRELWVSDGTAPGTTFLRDRDGNVVFDPRNIIPFGSSAVFQSSAQLFISNGTAGGTGLVLDTNPGVSDSVNEAVVFNGKVYFGARHPQKGQELWESDGTAGGTKVAIDPLPNTGLSPIGLIVAGNSLYFGGTVESFTQQLYKTDGTDAGTQVVKVLQADDEANPRVIPLFAMGELVLFSAFEKNPSIQLWRSDGTADGTFMLREFPRLSAGNRILQFTSANGLVYFEAPRFGTEVSGAIWRTDGTEAGTVQVPPFPGSSTPFTFQSILGVTGNHLLFAAQLPDIGRELFRVTDNCPEDVLKFSPGVCGCGVSDTDSDGDGVQDCNDQCPNSVIKSAPGQCGCNVADTDADSDGSADCVDECAADPAKDGAGFCGCSVVDSNSNGNALIDCLEPNLSVLVTGLPELSLKGRVLTIEVPPVPGAEQYECRLEQRFRNKKGKNKKVVRTVTSQKEVLLAVIRRRSRIFVSCHATNALTDAQESEIVRIRSRR